MVSKLCRTGFWLVPVLATAVSAAEPDRRVADAAKARDVKALAALVRQKADVNVPQADGATALHWAAHWDDAAMAGQLLSAGARVAALNDYGVMPIFLASTNGSDRMIDLLINRTGRVGL